METEQPEINIVATVGKGKPGDSAILLNTDNPLIEDVILCKPQEYTKKSHKLDPFSVYTNLWFRYAEGETKLVDKKWVTTASCVISEHKLNWEFGSMNLERITTALKYLEKHGYITVVETGDRKNSLNITLHDFGYFAFEPGKWHNKP